MALSQVGLERLNTATTKKIGTNKNIIINGAMQVAQRSSGTVAVSNNSNEGYQSLDRFNFSFGNNAAGAANISQSTDAPTTLGFTKSHKTDVTTANTTSTGDGVIGLSYKIEGQDIRNSGWNHLSDSSFLRLSFYFKTTKTGTTKLPIMFRTLNGTNYYYVKNITVSDPTNWNRYTCTIPGNSNLQIDDANTGGLAIFFTYYTGSDKDTSSEGSWGSTNAYSTSESTNYFDNTSNDMFITGIQLEVGSVATDFEHRSFSDELLRCQRYFYKTYNYDTTIGTAGSTGACIFSMPQAQSYAAVPTVRYPVTMRIGPTVTAYSTQNANTTGVMSADSTDKTTTIHHIGQNGHFPFVQNSSSGTGSNIFLRHQFTADAEL